MLVWAPARYGARSGQARPASQLGHCYTECQRRATAPTLPTSG